MHESAIIIYEHNGHTESPKFHVTEEIHNYIKEQKNLPPRQIYWNLIQLADDPRFKKTELHTITRQQVYNVWLSHTKTQWERDNADDFRAGHKYFLYSHSHSQSQNKLLFATNEMSAANANANNIRRFLVLFLPSGFWPQNK
ncbi:hypothetical protein V1505DRAFT_404789 [Lipomyces doorenjongii]